jgi:hypothetical protein
MSRYLDPKTDVVFKKIFGEHPHLLKSFLNAVKAYVNQLDKGENYHLLQPVYGLGLINTTFEPDEDHWYHLFYFS